MKYIVGTGYHANPGAEDEKAKFFGHWWNNTMKYSSPERVIVLANGGSKIPGAPGQWINLHGNLGHTSDLTAHRKPHHWCGWSWGFVTLAALAYMDECDLIFKEQDCVAFGPWVKHMYHEIGSAGIIYGNSRVMACAQSLVLIRHFFIPEFIKLYMQTGSEQDGSNECELKFDRLEKANPHLFTRYTFGVDRDRPIPYEATVFYAQQVKDHEVREMQRCGLL